MMSLTLLAFFGAIASSADANLGAQHCDTNMRPHVEEIYPTATVVPLNVLRFYVYFDAKMDRESSRDQIFVRNSRGEVLDGIFLQGRFELWSDDSRRLTVVLDPGRVKTGLSNALRLDDGLQTGRQFALIVGEGLTTAKGCAMATEFQHEFLVAGFDTDIPDPMSWEITAPKAQSLAPLEIALQKPLDHLSLAYQIRVNEQSGQRIAGTIELGENDEHWRFTPRKPWTAGRYQLVVDPALEDLAGNRPTGLFDDPSGESRVRQASAGPIIVPFNIDIT